jgi:hypothetical protein
MESYSNSNIAVLKILAALDAYKQKFISFNEIYGAIKKKNDGLYLDANTTPEQFMSYLVDVKFIASKLNGTMKYQITSEGIENLKKLKKDLLSQENV